MSILEAAKNVFRIEAEALLALAEGVNGDFEKAIRLILSSAAGLSLPVWASLD